MNSKYAPIVEKLRRAHTCWTAEEIDLLMQMLAYDGPDSLVKGEFAWDLVPSIYSMADDIMTLVYADAHENPIFNARLLPLYRRYIAQLKRSAHKLHVVVCRTILADTDFFN